MPAGRPLKFKTKEELDTAIDGYFNNTPKEEWTWTGLALYLDTNRQTLLNYEEREEFVDSIKKGLLKVENGYEIDLKKHGRTGTIFALKNFDWKDKTETDITSGNKPLPIIPLTQCQKEFIKEQSQIQEKENSSPKNTEEGLAKEEKQKESETQTEKEKISETKTPTEKQGDILTEIGRVG